MEITTIKCLLYCTKEKPYLTKIVELGKYYCAFKKGMNTLGYTTENELSEASLNGTVCFECEIEKAEEIENTLLHMAPTFMHETKTLCDSELLRRACLTPEEADEYMPKHALYLENVKEIKPFKIWELVRRDPTGLNIAEGLASGMHRAPQNMCWAWRWNDKGWERVLVLSLRPKNLCNIANGLKDIETRRQVVKEIKEMEK
jgi:hypothetical protein